jgi:L-iditol 2-dehydrogenase
MRAATITGKSQVAIRDVPKPGIGSHEILVRMRSCGICGTDIEKFHGDNITPPILGHEVAGEIEETGKGIQAFEKGERVIVHHHISCGSCFFCKNGLETLCEAFPKSNLDPCGFSEYFRVPQTLAEGGTVYELPDSMSFEEGSMVEPTACCLRAINKTGIRAGNSVAVFGVGPIGLAHIQLLKLHGAAPVFAVDVLPSRLQMAMKLGADRSHDASTEDVPEEIANATEGRGADLVIVATGSPRAFQQGISSARRGGKVVLFGAPARDTLVSLDLSSLFLREISIQSSYSTSEPEMRMALDLIQTKHIRPSLMITHRFPLEQLVDALHLAESGREAVKVIVENPA